MHSMPLDKYFTQTIRSWLGLRGDSTVDLSLPVRLQSELLNSEECSELHRDQWGNWEHSFLSRYHRGQLWHPTINYWVQSQRKKLELSGFELEPLWPAPYKSAICLTHDVDKSHSRLTLIECLRHISNLLRLSDIPLLDYRSLLRQSALAMSDLVSLLQSGHNDPKVFERIVQIEKRNNAVSTFFFAVQPKSYRSRYDPYYKMDDVVSFSGSNLTLKAVCNILKTEGFDVGLHGTVYSASDMTELVHQREQLESEVGFAVTSSRQHWLKWDSRLTPRLLAKAGIKADSTLGFNRNIGFRNGVAYPFFLYDNEAGSSLDVLEIPLAIQEGALWAANSLELSKNMSRTVVISILDRITNTQGCASVLFHPDLFSDPGIVEFYEWFLDECKKRSVWLTSVSNVNDWWRSRADKLALGALVP